MSRALDTQFRPPETAIPAIRLVCKSLLIRLIPAANGEGYALAVHGSLERDLDVIAVPWTTAASDVDSLVEALRYAVGGRLVGGCPSLKCHGRVAFTIALPQGAIETSAGAFPFIDLSVMPLQQRAAA